MAQAKQGDTVQVYYIGKLLNSDIFDTVTKRNFVQFTIGAGQIFPGFEEAVVGMKPGESKTITVAADKAYGPYRNEMVHVVDRNQLPADLKPEVGQQLEIRQEDGETNTARITDISESTVTLDANHPLAGQDLVFDIELAEIL
jgi:peptidylprolyl isomerase